MIKTIISYFLYFDYGEFFASAPGITVAVISTIGAILTAVFGPFKKFRLPSETAPGLSRGFLNFILFIPFILCFVLITPANAILALFVSLVGIPAAGIAMFSYGRVLANHRYTRPIPKGFLFWKRVGEEVIIGGTVLTLDAQNKLPSPLQTQLAMAEYKADEIWERASRTTIQQRVELFYFLFFFLAVTTVSAGALAVQALITKEAPLTRAQIIWAGAHPPTTQDGAAKPPVD